MEINFECKKCKNLFYCDVGIISMPKNSHKPHLEKEIICPECGQRSIDEVIFAEPGQSQLAKVAFDSDTNDISGSEADESVSFGNYEGLCQGCDILLRLNDLGLCEICTGKLDRDMIRERDWAYSVSAFGVPSGKLEELRQQVITQYGEKLELIAPSKKSQSKNKKKRNGKQKRRKSKR